MDSPKRIRSRQLDGVFQKVLGLWFGNALKESWLWSLCQFQWRIKSHVFRIPTKNRENKESFRPKPVRCGSNSNGNHIFPIADTIFIFFTVWCSSSPQTAWWSGNFFGVCVCVCVGPWAPRGCEVASCAGWQCSAGHRDPGLPQQPARTRCCCCRACQNPPGASF